MMLHPGYREFLEAQAVRIAEQGRIAATPEGKCAVWLAYDPELCSPSRPLLTAGGIGHGLCVHRTYSRYCQVQKSHEWTVTDRETGQFIAIGATRRKAVAAGYRLIRKAMFAMEIADIDAYLDRLRSHVIKRECIR